MTIWSVRLSCRVFKSLLLLSAFAILTACSPNSSAEFKLDIDIDRAALEQGRVVLFSTLSNQGDKGFNLLPWNTPLDKSITGEFLSVQKNTENGFVAMTYQGIMVKRLPPTEADFINLAPDQSVNNALDITRAYAFCAGQRYRVDLLQPMVSKDGIALELQVSAIEFATNSAFPACT